MVRFQSKRGNSYEYDPATSLINEDGWGKYYRGICSNASVSRDVRIYEINTKHRLPEPTLQYLNALSNFIYSHPNIIPIIDFVVASDEIQASDCQLFLIEEYVSGISLSNFLNGKIHASKDDAINEFFSMFQRDRVTFAKKIVKEVLQGIGFLHERALCLRYVDPENIVITKDGNVRIVMRNCYLHKILLAYDDRTTSGKGNLIHLFSPHLFPICYCSPEIILMFDFSDIDYRSDIYSVGILFFHMLTGYVSYKGQDMEIMSQHLNGKIPLCEIEDKQLRRIVKKATEKDRTKRYQSALEFLYEIDNSMKVRNPWYMNFFSFFYNKKKVLLCILLSTMFSLFYCPNSDAQNIMRINYKDGSMSEVPVEQIDSITFIEKAEETHDATLVGEWLWGNVEQGYYELLRFNEDKTYTGYDNYFTYGFDTMTYGFYSQYGTILTLWSNGFGYQHRYQWFIIGMSSNELSVMTKMGPFTYYRVQDEVVHLNVNESVVCTEGEFFIFADGIVVGVKENRLYGISPGITYIQKHVIGTNTIYSYKVVVE